MLVSAQDFAVALTEMNLLYKGVNNPVRISATGVSEKELIVETSDNISLIDRRLIKVISGREAYVTVGKLAGKDTVWLGKQVFRIRSLPQPTAQLGGIPNDGLPKGKASILAQTSVIASMGAGFAYSLRYQVTSFSLIVVYQNTGAKLFKHNSPQLSEEAKDAVRQAELGDMIIIEGITAKEEKHGFTARLAPIVLNIRGQTSLGNLQNSSYARIFKLKTDTSYLSSNSIEIAHELATMEDGVLDLFSYSKNGIIRTENVFANSNLVKITEFNDYNESTWTKEWINGSFWYYKRFEKDILGISAGINNNLTLFANKDFANCHQYNITAGRLNQQDSVCYSTLEKELLILFLEYEQTPIGPFTAYYPNGQIKTQGNLNIVRSEPRPEYIWCGTGINYYDYQDHSVMHGTWSFYKPDGSLLETREYDMGVLVK